MEFNTPWHDENGVLNFPLRMLHGHVVIWPIEEDMVSEGGIIIATEDNRKKEDFGYILACGPGAVDEKGKLTPMIFEVGQKVIYDKSVPWSIMVKTPDGNSMELQRMGMYDVKAYVIEE